jgi:molecular chaperone GrpE
MPNDEEIKKEADGEQQAAPPGAIDEDVVAELKEKLDLVSRERDEYLNGWRRTKADLANYRQQEFTRLEEMVKFGNEDIVKDLIPVITNFDHALASLTREGKEDTGIQMIRNQLEEVLKRRGLTRIPIEVGKPFDPAIEEVLLDEVSDKPPGTVLEVLEDGFTLHGKVVKPARVKISKEKS